MRVFLKNPDAMFLALILIFNIGTAASAGPRELGRSYLTSVGRTCRRVLIGFGILNNPQELRRHIETVRNRVRDLAKEDLQRGMPEHEAIAAAEIHYLVSLGFEPSLVRRWKTLDPDLFTKVLYHPRNTPVTGYRAIRVSPENFRLDMDTTYPCIFFEHKGVTKETMKFYGIDHDAGITIFQKIQVPAFASGVAPAISSLAEFPIMYPRVDPAFTKNFRAVLTHLQFPDRNNTWYPVETLLREGRLDLSLVPTTNNPSRENRRH